MLTWTSTGVEKPIEAKNFTINNWLGLQNSRILVILNGKYRKLWKTSNPHMAKPIASAYKAQLLPLDFLVMTEDETDVRR